jgi:2-methylcitrate dehydratase PrpD
MGIIGAAANLGQTFDIISPGINIKKYPCCYYTHAPVDALLYLINEHNISPQDIQHIRCGISQIAAQVLKHPYPANGVEGKFSVPYCLTLALLNNVVKIEDFQDDKVCDATINQYIFTE